MAFSFMVGMEAVLELYYYIIYCILIFTMWQMCSVDLEEGEAGFFYWEAEGF